MPHEASLLILPLKDPHRAEESSCVYLPTFLMQLSQFFLVLHPQVGHFLQLAIIPGTIMSGTEFPNQADEENVQKRGGKIRCFSTRKWNNNSRISTMNMTTKAIKRASLPRPV